MDIPLFTLGFLISFTLGGLYFRLRWLQKEIEELRPKVLGELLSGQRQRPPTDFEAIIEYCQNTGLGPEITAEMCWNGGYRLGRKRWYWGPSWMVDLRGWINTRIYALRNRRKQAD